MLGVRRERGRERERHTFWLVDVFAQADEDVHFGVPHFGLPCLYHYCWVTPCVLSICEKHIDLKKYIQSSKETSCRNAEDLKENQDGNAIGRIFTRVLSIFQEQIELGGRGREKQERKERERREKGERKERERREKGD
jgi:hypothetical protein